MNEDNPKLQRQYSARSEDAMERLNRYDELLAAKEKRFASLVASCAKVPPTEELLQIKNELAIMVGEIDKLQMTGIDSVMVGHLESGKEEAKKNRKDLNRRAEKLGERIRELHAEIVAHLKKQNL